jgi:hypothetical protein
VQFLPISALNGDNVVDPSPNAPWHKGPPLLGLLETIHIASDWNLSGLRWAAQLFPRAERSMLVGGMLNSFGRLLTAWVVGVAMGAGGVLWFFYSGSADVVIGSSDVVQALERRLEDVEEQRNQLARQLEDVAGRFEGLDRSFEALEERYRQVAEAAKNEPPPPPTPAPAPPPSAVPGVGVESDR